VLNKTQNIFLIPLLLVLSHTSLHATADALNQTTTPQTTEASSNNEEASLSASASQKVYKVVGENGDVIYTDKPQPNAEPLLFDGQTQNVVKAVKVPPPSPLQPDKPKPNYKVVIKSPAPEATIRNNLGELTISAAQTGAPKAPIYRLIFDDAPIASNNSGIFKLSGIHRGAHTYKVELTNNTGKTLASSPVQTLYLHQASALINN